jgi:hypothetical protein
VGAIATEAVVVFPAQHEKQITRTSHKTGNTTSIYICPVFGFSTKVRQWPLEPESANIFSVFVHAADAYLHIATAAVDMVQIFPQAPINHRYGRIIDPWCLDNYETMGTIQNKNFWGCALTLSTPTLTEDTVPRFTNQSAVSAVQNENYEKFITNFTDETGTKYAVLAPMDIPSDTDWQATSFAISSQCALVPPTSCSIDMHFNVTKPFNCSLARGSPIDFSGTLHNDRHVYSFSDFHKYMKENEKPFLASDFEIPEDAFTSIIPNATEQDATEMFPSTWRWTAVVNPGLGPAMTLPADMMNVVWPGLNFFVVVVACNSTGTCPLFNSSR